MDFASQLSLVSVLLPAYNHQNYIQDSIRSIISQAYPNIELLILDDGSSDATWDKIGELRQECEDRFTRLTMHTRTNKGRVATFNELLYSAQGEYIFFIASDDIAKPEAIEKLYTFLASHNDYVMAVGDNEFIGESNERIFWDIDKNAVPASEVVKYTTFAQYLKQRHPGVDFCSKGFGSYPSLLKGNYIPNGYLVRRSAMLEFGGYTEEAPLEDWYQHMQLAKQGKIKFIDEVLFSYRWHTENTVKLSQYMNKVTTETLNYEKKIVDESGDKELQALFYEAVVFQKVWFLQCAFLSIRKEKSKLYKDLVVEVFGCKLRIRYRKYY